MLRKILLNIHMYGGLLCFSYLILFGISTLNFNHTDSFTNSPTGVTAWSQPVAPSLLTKTEGKPATEAQTIRRQNNRAVLHALGSFAAPSTDADGNWTDADTYHARFTRPGNQYDVDVHPARGTATITRTRPGFWALVRDLHGSSVSYPDSILASTWAWYTELCTLFVLFAGITGVYLWAPRRRRRRTGLTLLLTAGAVSIALMLLVTFHG